MSLAHRPALPYLLPTLIFASRSLNSARWVLCFHSSLWDYAVRFAACKIPFEVSSLPPFFFPLLWEPENPFHVKIAACLWTHWLIGMWFSTECKFAIFFFLKKSFFCLHCQHKRWASMPPAATFKNRKRPYLHCTPVQMAGVSSAACKQGQSRCKLALHRPIDQYLDMKINGCRSV